MCRSLPTIPVSLVTNNSFPSSVRLIGVITKYMSNFPLNVHENCGEMWINVKPMQRDLLTLGVTCSLDYQRIKIGILVESLGNECSATVSPTHDPDASVQLSLN
jgi:hypothetical protein